MLICRGEDSQADADADTGTQANHRDHYVEVLREARGGLDDGGQNDVCTIQD